jgi:uncharacterized membrane protein YqhA
MRTFLARCRYLLIGPVIGCILLAAGIVILGIGRVFSAGWWLISEGDFSKETAKIASLAAIEIIDLFLIATVSYIAAVGIYKLFIGKQSVKLPMRLSINSLKDLEDKIIGIIVAALAVAFLGQAATSKAPEALLNYGGGIALVIVALAFFIRQPDKKKPTPEPTKED